MAFNTNTGRAEYVASAGQTVFTYVFKTYNTSDIKAYLTPDGSTPDDTADLLTETTDYAIVQNGDNGGTLTLVVAAGLDDTIVLVRELPIDRETDYQPGGDLLSETLDDDQDLQTYLIQQNKQDTSRFLKFGDTTVNVDNTVPSFGPGYFKYKDDGTGIELDTTATDASAASAAAALVSENNAAASESATAADLVLTNADVILTNADVASTNADVVLTNADVALTNADVVLTNADVVSSAANAAASQAAELSWTTGGWVTATDYTASTPRQALKHNGASYVCILNHTSDATTEPLIGASWATYWEVLAEKGSAGTGTGDLLAANNLDDVASAATSRINLGLQIGVNIQEFLVSGTNIKTINSASLLGSGNIAIASGTALRFDKGYFGI